jgi:hypothetical protein
VISFRTPIKLDRSILDSKNLSYLSILRNPEKADLNKNKKIEGWEKSRGKAIEKAMERRGRK